MKTFLTVHYGKVINLPNTLSIARLLFVICSADYVLKGDVQMATFFALLAVASDWLDGFLARKLGLETNLGKVLDGVCDRLSVAIIGTALAWAGLLPLWLLITLLGRDFAVMIAGACLLKKIKQPPPASEIGKITTAAKAMVLLAHLTQSLFNMGVLALLCLDILLVFLLLFSLFQYALKFGKLK